MPDSIEHLYSGAFADCVNLSAINIPDNVTSVDKGVFKNTALYNNDTNWYNDVLIIDSHLVDMRDTISELFIGKNVKRVHTECLYITPKYNYETSTMEPENYIAPYTRIIVDNDYYDSRDNCNAIIETATNKLIRGCDNTTIPDGIITIDSDAFKGCRNLTSITIPSSVTSIGDMAFQACNNLNNITFTGTIEQWNNIEKGWGIWGANDHMTGWVPATYVQCSDGQVTL